MLEAEFSRFEALLGLGDLVADPLLFLPEKLDRDRPGVVRTEESALLVLETGQSGALGFCFPNASPLCVVQMPLYVALHGRAAFRLQHDVRVEVLHGFFDSLGEHIGLVAAGALRPSQAEEVEVLAFRVSQAEATVTAGTEHRALEVMIVLPVLLARDVMGRQHGADPVECLAIDKRLVLSRPQASVPADDPDVVGVAEHASDA